MGRVLSGVQPTGNLHLGNYLGAIKNWVAMQDEHECLFCIVDLHAITVPQDPKYLREASIDTAAAYIASGIDPLKSAIFVQSMIPAHAELAWILGTFTPLGWLNRMTQFKEKSGKDKEKNCLGLYSYPVLMAADILLYQATHVPVGEDQKQHLELARDIAGVYNNYYNKEFFILPEPLIMPKASRIMSLRDGTKKMSKSDSSDYSRICFNDSQDEIAKKIKKAKSDIHPFITYDPEKRPELSNFIDIYAALSGLSNDDILLEFANYGFANFKNALTDLVVAKMMPIFSEYKKLKEDKVYLYKVLADGLLSAKQIAGDNIEKIKKNIGFFTL